VTRKAKGGAPAPAPAKTAAPAPVPTPTPAPGPAPAAAQGGPRYVVGIDLGTTNTVLAFADAAGADARVEVFPVPQLVAPGDIQSSPILPSAVYLPSWAEARGDALLMPWAEAPAASRAGAGGGAAAAAPPPPVVGAYARDQGARVPSRLVSSAKSWLCYGGVDRRAPVLPFGADEKEVPKISPVRAQELILRHLAAAWDAEHAASGARLADQEVLLCVPASFDAVARELTLEAARAAGLRDVTLVEEPQAAFYAWLWKQGDAWRRRLRKGDVVLVCDLGGGTTDFSLIAVSERGGDLELERIAVGEHLLLGGDNMDLTLAHLIAIRLGGNLDPWQSRALWLACRAAKEELFLKPDKTAVTVAVGGRGTKLVGDQIQGTLGREDLERAILEGFFPLGAATDRPAGARRTALKELGLPFVADPGVSRHLASFLGRHARPEDADGFVRPRFVLFNGGVMKAAPLRDRVLSLLASWGDERVEDLGGAEFDLAVALGAAYYGLVRRGRGIRIRGGAARSYYVGIETAMPAVPFMPPPLKALCVVPFGLEEGSEVDLPGRELGLLTGDTAEFRFFGSTTRKEDRPGDLLDSIGDDLSELSPIEATIEAEGAQRVVPITLKARLTEVGTLELFCVDRGGGREWRLEYNVRAADGDGDRGEGE